MDKLNVCSGFFDLNIQWEKNSIIKTLAAAKQLGYNVVAINTYMEESVFEPKKKKKKGEAREIGDVVPAPWNLEDLGASEEVIKNMKILRRLTVELGDSLQAHKLAQSENFKKYDLVAVVPNSQNALQHACSSLDVDIISFNPTNRLPLRITRKMYIMATERGLYFELMYSPAIKDSTARRNIISMSHMYHAIGKSKNIFVTSNGADPYDLRGPYDVMNLCLILGMSEEKTKGAISDGCRSLYIRSVGRRCGKAVVWVSRIPSDSDSESLDEEMECSSSNDDNLQSLESVSKKSKSDEMSSSKDKTSSSEFAEKSKPLKRFRTESSTPDDEDKIL